MKNKGFTLIEVLATLLIIGIIAVIAFPIVKNYIGDSKEQSAKISAKFFVKATEEKVVLSKIENGLASSVYYPNSEENKKDNVLYDGMYTTDQLKELGVSIKKVYPSNGTVTIKKGQVVDCQLEINNYTVSCTSKKNDYSAKLNKKYDVMYEDFRCNIKGTGKVNPVYFNAETGNKCTKAEYEQNLANHVNIQKNNMSGWGDNDPTYLINGCMKWYPYYYNSDNTVDMILDHNIENSVCWAGPHPQYSFDCNDATQNGPIGGVEVLRNKTNHWNGVPTRTDSYSLKNSTFNYTISYTGMKARLISAEEVAKIVGNNAFSTDPIETGNESGTSGVSESFFLDSCFHKYYFTQFNVEGNQFSPQKIEKYLEANKSLYSWLFEQSACGNSGCNNVSNTNWGYMTSTGLTTTGENSYQAWQVFAGGAVIESMDWNTLGVRPVITIPSSKIK